MIKKVICVNLILILLLFLLSELYFWKKMDNRYDMNSAFFKIKHSDNVSIYPPGRFHRYEETYNQKKPILLLGCSFAYGEFIAEEDNFSSQLKKISNRWVYNWGEPGQGPIYSLMLLNIEQENKLITEEPEYIIYLYMFHHVVRYYFAQYYNYYREQKWIPNQTYTVFDNFYTYKYFRDIKLEQYFSDDENYEKRLDLFFKIVKMMKKKSEQLFPNSKFVVLIYSDVNKNLCQGLWDSVNNDEKQMKKLFEIMNSAKFREKLSNENIQVITTEELIGRKMNKASDRAENDPHYPHPSAKAWKELVPKLVDYMKL